MRSGVIYIIPEYLGKETGPNFHFAGRGGKMVRRIAVTRTHASLDARCEIASDKEALELSIDKLKFSLLILL